MKSRTLDRKMTEVMEWERAREMGRTRYALTRGVFGYGIIVVLPWAASMILLDYLFDEVPFRFGRFVLNVVVAFLLFGAVGYFTRIRRWDAMRKRHGSSD